jgi:hypothetical protein
VGKNQTAGNRGRGNIQINLSQIQRGIIIFQKHKTKNGKGSQICINLNQKIQGRIYINI